MPELCAEPAAPVVWLNIADGSSLPAGSLVHRHADDHGRVWFDLERTPHGYRFNFPDVAQFGFDQLESTLSVHAAPGTATTVIHHLLLDQVLPILLVLEGLTVLHASAVAVGAGEQRRALLFVGESGAGKSTTEAGCTRAGAALLADDFSLIDVVAPSPTVTPSGTGSRLWGDVLDRIEPASPERGDEPKSRLAPPRSQEHGAVPIEAIYVLGERSGPGTDPAVTPLAPGEACITLLSHSFRGSVTDPAENQRALEACARLVEAVAVRKLTLPTRLADLVAVCEQVLKWDADQQRPPARAAGVAANL